MVLRIDLIPPFQIKQTYKRCLSSPILRLCTQNIHAFVECTVFAELVAPHFCFIGQASSYSNQKEMLDAIFGRMFGAYFEAFLHWNCDCPLSWKNFCELLYERKKIDPVHRNSEDNSKVLIHIQPHTKQSIDTLHTIRKGGILLMRKNVWKDQKYISAWPKAPTPGNDGRRTNFRARR